MKSLLKGKGAFILFVPFLMIAVFGFSAMAVDLGIIRVANAELRYTTEAAARAAVNALPNGNNAAITAANNIISQAQLIGNTTINNVQIQLGTWNRSNHTFTPTETAPNAARITANVTPTLYFSNVINAAPDPIASSATATTPLSTGRDILLVVELDGNEKFHSIVVSNATTAITRAWAESNRQAIFNAAGFGPYGNLTWTNVYYSSTTNTATIKTNLGLNGVPFPVAGSSWENYINMIKSSLYTISAYRNQYSYQTLMYILLYWYGRPSFLNMLWKTPIYPLQTTKDSIRNFTAQLNSDDRVALISYEYESNFTNFTMAVETPFTSDFTAPSRILDGNVSANVRGRQPDELSRNVGNGNLVPVLTSVLNYMITNGDPQRPRIIYFITLEAPLTTDHVTPLGNLATIARNNKITFNLLEPGYGYYYSQVASYATAKTNATQTTGGQWLYYPTLYPLVNFDNRMKTMLDNATQAFSPGSQTSGAASAAGSAQIVE